MLCGGLRVFEKYHLSKHASLLYCEQLDRNNNSELILLVINIFMYLVKCFQFLHPNAFKQTLSRKNVLRQTVRSDVY